ncbi:MAG: hypothetical protein NUV67_02145, partial [archaeon]|nr:hypothetical protein [archaeon]
MGFSKQQVWSLFIVIIMVGSILGIVGLSGQDNSNQSPPPTNQNPTPPTTVDYLAQNVEAKVIELFPTAILVASTSSFETPPVDSALLGLEGISTLANGQFITPAEGRTENYRAEIRLSSTKNISGVIAQANDLNLLSNVQIFPQALVAVPEKITFTNPELGLTKEYSFPRRQAPAVVDSGTFADDEVLVSIYSTFQGNTLVNVQAIENQNLTSQPAQYPVTSTFVISSLSNDFSIFLEESIEKQAALGQIKSSLEGDFNAALSMQEPQKMFVVYFEDANSFFGGDLKTFFEE